MRRVVILLPILLFVGCRHCVCSDGIGASRSVTRFTAGDAPPVDSGRYPGQLRMLSGHDPLALKAAPLRADAESHESILRALVRERMSVKSPLEFRFMYAGHDSLNGRLILRYFSRKESPDVIAGWQVQLVYSLPSLEPVRAYVQAVPLE